jgi:hypothetical protein
VAPTCSDGILNGDESGTDCGGPDCSTCGAGGGCTYDSDCVSNVCEDGICRKLKRICLTYFSDKFIRQRPPVLTVYATKTSLTLTVVVLIARLVAARAKAAAVTLIARAANASSLARMLNLELAVSYLEIGSLFWWY